MALVASFFHVVVMFVTTMDVADMAVVVMVLAFINRFVYLFLLWLLLLQLQA